MLIFKIKSKRCFSFQKMLLLCVPLADSRYGELWGQAFFPLCLIQKGSERISCLSTHTLKLFFPHPISTFSYIHSSVATVLVENEYTCLRSRFAWCACFNFPTILLAIREASGKANTQARYLNVNKAFIIQERVNHFQEFGKYATPWINLYFPMHPLAFKSECV